MTEVLAWRAPLWGNISGDVWSNQNNIKELNFGATFSEQIKFSKQVTSQEDRGYIGVLENTMETTLLLLGLYRHYIGIMENLLF